MTFAEIATYAFAALGAAVTAASAASAFLPKESAAGLWLAWFASMPLKHRPTKAVNVTGTPLVVLAVSASLVGASLLSGCGKSALHTTVDKVLVYEQQVQSESVQLKVLADAAIPLLPADKQETARAALVAAFDKLATSLAAKDTLLQTALDASADDVSIAAVTVDIARAIDDIVSLLRLFGVGEAQLAGVTVRVGSLRAAGAKL